ncbi:MAG TPA: hypothetical protein VEL07_21860, partial [Planctomycetota bacterium]|nr:hypothetical protein [Planctomycetota bacterium]
MRDVPMSLIASTCLHHHVSEISMRRLLSFAALLCFLSDASAALPHDGGLGVQAGVDNHQMTYTHHAWDYAVDAPEGCTSCGSAETGGIGSLPRLMLQRIHRYRDLDRPSSFGPGVYLGYDITLDCASRGSTNTIASLFDPRERSATQLTDPNADGVYEDAKHQAVKWLRFYNATGVQVAHHKLATTAQVRTHEGSTYHFALIRVSSDSAATERVGRLTSIADRNGHAITVAYAFAVNATDVALGYERVRLWQIATITDAYGKVASFTYRVASQAGRRVVERIDAPNGSSIAYTYGANSLVSLSGVTHGDGTTSTFVRSDDGSSQTTTIQFTDPAAASTAQRKATAHFTRIAWAHPQTFALTQQPYTLLRRVSNGEQEIGYDNRTRIDTTTGELHVTTYVGHASVRHVYTQLTGLPLRREVMLTGAAPTRTIESFGAWDGFRRLLERSDGLNQKTTYQRDPRHGAITRTTYPDNSFETTTYNDFKQPLESRDRRGRVTTYEYDAQGNLRYRRAATGTPDAAVWEWRYAEAGANARAGQPTSSIDARGNVTRYAYDASGFLERIIEPRDDAADAANPTKTFHVDTAGRVDWTRDQASRQTSFAYDARNRVTVATYGDTSTDAAGYGSDAAGTAGLKVWSRDRNGNHTVIEYDASSRVTRRLSGLRLLAGKTSSANLADYANLADASITAISYFLGTELATTITVDGKTTRISYDGYRREIERSHTPRATAITDALVYDDAGRVDTRIRRIGTSEWRTLYVYDGLGRVTRTIRDVYPSGAGTLTTAQRQQLTRNVAANAPYVIEDVQYDVDHATHVYDPHALVATRIKDVRITTDARGIKRVQAFDHQGRLAEAIDAFQATIATRTLFEHDAEGNTLRTYHPRHFSEPTAGGFVTVATYGGRNLVRTVTEAWGRIEASMTATLYSPTGKPASVTVASGTVDAATTVYRYGTCCDRLTQVEDGQQFITAYAYDFVGNVLTVTDPLLHTTVSTYDSRNRLLTRTNGDNETTTFAYDDNVVDAVGLSATWQAYIADLGFTTGRDGALVRVTNPLGKNSLRVLDDSGRVVRTVDELGQTTTVTYEAVASESGLPGTVIGTNVTDALNRTSGIRVDGLGRQVATKDATGAMTVIGYDPNGNRISVRDANGIGHDCTFDELDRDATCTDTYLAQTVTTFDAHGNQTSSRDALLKTTTHVYDARDRRTSTTDRVAGTTTFAYDKRNNLVQLKDAQNGITAYVYDKRNLLKTETFPGTTGGTRTYTYDAAGRLGTRV